MLFLYGVASLEAAQMPGRAADQRDILHNEAIAAFRAMLGSVAEKCGTTVRQANWCQCSRWESGRRKKASLHLHPESWAVIHEAGG